MAKSYVYWENELIKQEAERLGLCCNFCKGRAYITTAVALWIFNPRKRPIYLLHENHVQTETSGKFNRTLHRQNVKLNTPEEVLMYIRNHDIGQQRRLEQRKNKKERNYEAIN